MTDLREFRRICYEAARRTGGRVVEFRVADSVTPNYHQGIIAYRDHTVAVVGSRDLPLLAVAEPQEAWSLTFVDAPDLVAVLAEFPEWRVLTPADLNGPYDPAVWPDVHFSAAEFKYWKPTSLGEVLFNHWD